VRVDIVRVVGGLCVRQHKAGFGPKNQNRAFMARFQVCHVKRQCKVMTGGGGWGLISWRWRVG
jgi:hypothetical protein